MINWLKQNWLILVIVTIAFVYGRSSTSPTIPIAGGGINTMMAGSGGLAFDSVSSKMMPTREVALSDSANRLVIQDTSLSLQVKDVPASISQIEVTTKNLGGYMINSNLNRPDQSASGNISVRVPEEKRSEAMTEFSKLAVKVVSRSVYANDVTDQYTDLDAQLEVLLQTKQKFQEILAKATQVNDLMNVQQQLTNIQQQIDSIKGQQKYYEQSAKLTKISIYLSTDELALPYAPTNEWRPAVVFKEAVRSLIANVRNLGNFLIWGAVYSPIIFLLVIIYWYFIKKRA
ncbi:DUF4349 domain-containing protein [Candidatus Shapirobacteria bacterium]|nr:DUF4349 domain-containing protein [Candidatus Shapirobacteria bacterium]